MGFPYTQNVSSIMIHITTANFNICTVHFRINTEDFETVTAKFRSCPLTSSKAPTEAMTFCGNILDGNYTGSILGTRKRSLTYTCSLIIMSTTSFGPITCTLIGSPHSSYEVKKQKKNPTHTPNIKGRRSGKCKRPKHSTSRYSMPCSPASPRSRLRVT